VEGRTCGAGEHARVGEAEVGEANVAVGTDEQVVGLDVAVDDAQPARVSA